MLRNTYVNSKAIEYTNPTIKQRNNRKVTWMEVQRPTRNQPAKEVERRSMNDPLATKSILKTKSTDNPSSSHPP